MARKSSRNTKARIVSAAWKLFYEQGYEETTVAVSYTHLTLPTTSRV